MKLKERISDSDQQVKSTKRYDVILPPLEGTTQNNSSSLYKPHFYYRIIKSSLKLLTGLNSRTNL